MKVALLFLPAVIFVLVAAPDEARHGEAVRFNRDVRPILAESCFRCHGADPEQRSSKLRLDQEEGLFNERKHGPVVVKGSPYKSPLYQRIMSEDAEKRMPPAEAHTFLTPAQKETIRRWIAQGAEYEPHWSYIKPMRTAAPRSRNANWIRNPIDTYVAARLDAAGLSPAPEASRPLLARRVSLDLTGLPPDPALVDEFVSDASADAYEKLVEKLLASPRYGEHRARYWLDAARYADTHGLHFDNYREMWPYRDWVINAFNRNQPFDQFTIEQLAGDLLPEPTKDQLIATGFHRCNVTTNEAGTVPEENFALHAKDRVETTASVWLGLTANCCACHDHKFDPLTQKEYYAMSAFFRNTVQPAVDDDVRDAAPAMVLFKPGDKELWNGYARKIAEAQRAIDARRSELRAAFDASRNAEPWTLEAARVPAGGTAARVLPFGSSAARAQKEKDDLFDAHIADDPELLDASARVRELEFERDAIRDRVTVTHVMVEDSQSAPMAHILIRGEYYATGDRVEPGVFGALHPFPAGAPKNRLGLAQWIVSAENPLTVRVTVNRLWQEIFGAGLVRTPGDFGVMGEQPTHPDLLDYLAAEFRDGGWNVKKLIRQIVTSATYRQSAAADSKSLEKDVSLQLLSRGPRFRMDAEMIRDVALSASGLLARGIGGPSVKPYQPDNVWESVAVPGSNTFSYSRDQGDNLYRRSLYTFWKRAAPPASLFLFNAPSRELSCVMRERTNTPLQALVTLNDPQFVEAARVLAQRALQARNAAPQTLDLVARRVLSRSLSSEEASTVLELQRDLLTHYAADQQAARELLSVGDFPTDAAIPPEALAAWTMVCSVLLNLDEALNK